MFDFLFGRLKARKVKRKPHSRNYRPGFDVLERRDLLAMTYWNITGSSPVQEPLTTSETKFVSFGISVSGMGGMPPDSASITWTASSQGSDTATANVDYQALSGTVSLGPS